MNRPSTDLARFSVTCTYLCACVLCVQFKLHRKSRDPAKELAEWKKIKGLAAGKGQ